MNSAHFGFRDAFSAALSALPSLADGGVKTGKRRPMPEAVGAQIFVDLDDSPALPVTVGNLIEWSTRIRVEVMARDLAGERADKRADQILVDAYSRVMADPYFGGLSLQTDPAGLAWHIEDEAEVGISAACAVFTVRHRTPRAALTV